MNTEWIRKHCWFGALEEEVGYTITPIKYIGRAFCSIVICENKQNQKFVLRIRATDETSTGEKESAKYLHSVNNDYIVQVTDFREVETFLFTFMPFYEYMDLATLMMKPNVQLSQSMIIHIVYQLAQALRFLHSDPNNVVVHRDMDLNNIFVETFHTEKDFIKIRLADFELSKVIKGSEFTSTCGRKKNYPPKNKDNEYECGPSADIWCLGAIMYRLLTNDRDTDLSSFKSQKLLDEFIKENVSSNKLYICILFCMKFDRKERINSTTLTELLFFELSSIKNGNEWIQLFNSNPTDTKYKHLLSKEDEYFKELFKLTNPNITINELQNSNIPPNSIAGFLWRGNSYFRIKQFQNALNDYNEVIKLHPYIGYKNRGLVYYSNQNYGKAINDFSKLFEENMQDNFVYYNRGICYICERKYEEAILDFTNAIGLNGKDFESYYNRARCYLAQKLNPMAILDLKIIIDTCQDKELVVKALINRGICNYNLEKYEDSIKDYDEVINIWSTELLLKSNEKILKKGALVYSNRGNCKYKLRLYEQALTDYGESIRLNPLDDWTYYNRGKCFAKIKNVNLARIYFTKAIELNKNNRLAKAELDELRNSNCILC